MQSLILPPTTRRNRRKHTRARAIAGLALRALGLALIAAAAVHVTRCTADRHREALNRSTAACLAYAHDPDAARLTTTDLRLAEPSASQAAETRLTRRWEADKACRDFAAGRTRWIDEQDLADASPAARAAAHAALD